MNYQIRQGIEACPRCGYVGSGSRSEVPTFRRSYGGASSYRQVTSYMPKPRGGKYQ